jgi:hypothetical protein
MTALGTTLLALLATIGSARAVTVTDLSTNPDAYDGQTVSVTGTVELALPAGGESAYDLRDGTRKITVLSRSTAPAPATRLSVTGTVHVFHEEGGEGNDWPPALVETSRSVVP